MFRTEVWVVSTLFFAGVVAGMIATWPDSKIASPQTSFSPNPVPLNSSDDEAVLESIINKVEDETRPDDRVSGFPNPELIKQTRNHLMAGGYDRAARGLRLALEEVPLRDPRSAASAFVWLGLAEELAGRTKAASLAYSTGLKGNADPKTRSVALVGLARNWESSGRQNESIELLFDLFLHSEDFFRREDNWLNTEIQWALGVALRNKAIKFAGSSGLKFPAFVVDPPLDVETIVERLTPMELSPDQSAENATEQKPVATTGPGITVVQAPAADPELISVDVNLDTDSVSSLLRQLAGAANWSLQTTPAAQKQLIGRSKSIHIRNASLAVLFDVLLLPIDLQWTLQEDSIFVDVVAPQEKLFRWARTSDHFFSTYSFVRENDFRNGYPELNRGILALLRRDYDSAATDFQSALQAAPEAEILARVLINQAVLDHHLGRESGSIEKLYRTIDTTLDESLRSEAWSLVASFSLDQGDFTNAIKSSNRSLMSESMAETRRRAVIAAALAYLEKNEPVSANQIVFDNRDVLESDEDTAKTARFLGSYARYLGSESTYALSRETPRLLKTLVVVESVSQSAPMSYMSARAWKQLGFDDRAISALSQGLAMTPSRYWKHKLAWELADLFDRNGMRNESAMLLEDIAADSNSRLAVPAILDIANRQLASGKADVAVQTAQSVLRGEGSGDSEKRRALQIMGHAYRKLDQPHAAAICFSGMLPETANVGGSTSAGEPPR